MAARSAAAVDLLQQNPLLLWLLADTVRTQHWGAEKTDQLLRSRHIEILERVTGVRSKSALKILRKIEPLKGSKEELRLVRTIIQSEELRRPLVHLPSVSVCGLAVLECLPQFSGSQLLQAIFSQQFVRLNDGLISISESKPIWDDALYLAQLLEIGDANLALKRCSSLEDIQRLHDRWMNRLNSRSHLLVNGNKAFPPPPLPGNADIHPIQSEEDLYLEGRLMHHCIAAYARRVHIGQCYIYRVMQPERGTLELQCRNSAYTIGQFNLARNGSPSQGSWEIVQEWFVQATAEEQSGDLTRTPCRFVCPNNEINRT